MQTSKEFFQELLNEIDNSQLSELVRTLSMDGKTTSGEKKKKSPVIWAKRPSTVHLTVHCLHCFKHYTTIKQIRDNDLVYYSTNKDGSVAKTKLVAEGDTWIDTYTQCCNACEQYVLSLSLEELQKLYITNLLKQRRF